MCPAMMAHWLHMQNTSELCFLRPTRVHNPNGKSISSAVFFPAQARKSIIPILYNGYPFPPKLPLPTGIWTPFNLWFLGPVQAHNPNSITKCLYNLQWAAPYPSKLLIPMGDQDPPSNTWFPGNTRVLNSNGISSGSSVFAGSLVWQTDRQTHKQTERQTDRPIDHSPWSVTTVRI